MLFWISLARLAAAEPLQAMPLEILVENGHERAWLPAAGVQLSVPERLADFREAADLGISMRNGEPTVRFAGQFLVWSEERRVRWLLGETRVNQGSTQLWVVDRDLGTGTEASCAFAQGHAASTEKPEPSTLRVRTQLTVGATCAAPPPPLACDGPPPTVRRKGRRMVRLPEGGALLDPVMNGETTAQERGWIQPVVANALHRAAHETLCIAAERGWPGTGWPLVVGDRSLRDGSIPTWQGVPAHPSGSHTDGWDADIAYFQAGWAPDNDMRPVCVHADTRTDHRHCLHDPVLLDARRTAMFIGLLAQSKHVRCVGVDGRVARRVLEAQRSLAAEGLLDAVGDKLCFESEDTGRGWFYGHHDHLHVQGQRPPGTMVP